MFCDCQHCQHINIKNRSLHTSLYKYIVVTISALDNGEAAVGLFVDFTKAFDCVNRTFFLHKLQSYGIRRGTLTIRSFFLRVVGIAYSVVFLRLLI